MDKASLSLFGDATAAFVVAMRKTADMLDGMPDEQRIEALNDAREILHAKSPYKNHPVDCVLWVKTDEVTANNYNPNNVAPPEMRLLEISIKEDGYTMPAVVSKSPTGYDVVDGWHRHRVAKEKMSKPLAGRIPISVLNKPYEDRMASTIRHNRARGVHGVAPMTDIVAHLAKSKWTDEEIGKRLGMCKDEVLRLKQCSGLAEIFKGNEFSKSWERE